jgi:hypothetical protein
MIQRWKIKIVPPIPAVNRHAEAFIRKLREEVLSRRLENLASRMVN